MAETEMSLRRDDDRIRPEGALVLAELIRRFCGALLSLAGDDTEVIGLIDTYASGCDDRADVMQRLGWTLPKFINVRRRLSTLIAHLPADLRAAALDAVTRVTQPQRALAA